MKKLGLGGILLVCGLLSLAAKDDDRKQSAEAVEKLQKIELEKYFYGLAQGGNAPALPMAIKLYNEASEFFEKGEYKLAHEAASESLQLEPRNPLAWELLGELANLQQDFEKAKDYYQKSYRLNPSPRVKAKLEKLGKEQLVESKLDTYDEEHFIIKYRRGDPRYEGAMLKDLLFTTYRAVSRDLGFYLRNKIVVLFYEADEFRYVTEQPHFVGGLYDGKIRLPAYRKGMTERDLRALVRHEMAHAFVAYMSGLRAPAWVQEGLAEYEENKVRPVDLSVLKAARRSGETIPIDRFLLMGADMKSQPGELALFYQQAFSFTSYLVERFGMYRIKEILGEMKKGNDSFTAIENVLRISSARLEKEWLASLK